MSKHSISIRGPHIWNSVLSREENQIIAIHKFKSLTKSRLLFLENELENYLLNSYRTTENITVVFDGGYLFSSSKESTHIRWSKVRLGRKILPSFRNLLTEKNGDFLLNKHNKQAFRDTLGIQLSASSIQVIQSDGDKAMDIVPTALTVPTSSTLVLQSATSQPHAFVFKF